jgi:hypothetical protein
MSNRNEPAFPVFPESETGHASAYRGMTLRDYFAAQALTGAQVWDAVLNGQHAVFSDGVVNLAEVAYKVADAMLAERDK